MGTMPLRLAAIVIAALWAGQAVADRTDRHRIACAEGEAHEHLAEVTGDEGDVVEPVGRTGLPLKRHR